MNEDMMSSLFIYFFCFLVVFFYNFAITPFAHIAAE